MSIEVVNIMFTTIYKVKSIEDFKRIEKKTKEFPSKPEIWISRKDFHNLPSSSFGVNIKVKIID